MSQEKKIIVGNLKMNLTSTQERDKYLAAFKKEMKELGESETEIILCPPHVYLEDFAKKLHPVKSSKAGISPGEIISQGKTVLLGAQNVFWQDSGSYTGEISPLMVRNLGAQYCLVGHSERRRYMGETNEQVNQKVKAALKNELKPILCVGETREQRDNGDTSEIIVEQITEGLKETSAYDAENIIIAYEPVWSIGSDAIPTSDEILQIKILLKKIFADMFGLEIAEKMRLLYGGSVKADVLEQVCLKPGLSGVLVGRESLTPKDFLKIIKALEK